MSENELSNGFDTDGISKLNRETDDADEENIDISTTKSENNYEDNFDIPVQKKTNEKKSPRMVRLSTVICNGVQREHNKKLNNGLPILHKVPPKRDYGRYFCIMAEKGGTFHGGLTEKLSLFFHAKKQEVNAYGR